MSDLDIDDHIINPIDKADLKKTLSERIAKSVNDSFGVKNNLRAVQ
jgi:hypothetical protein